MPACEISIIKFAVFAVVCFLCAAQLGVMPGLYALCMFTLAKHCGAIVSQAVAYRDLSHGWNHCILYHNSGSISVIALLVNACFAENYRSAIDANGYLFSKFANETVISVSMWFLTGGKLGRDKKSLQVVKSERLLPPTYATSAKPVWVAV